MTTLCANRDTTPVHYRPSGEGSNKRTSASQPTGLCARTHPSCEHYKRALQPRQRLAAFECPPGWRKDAEDALGACWSNHVHKSAAAI